jgi:ankyrin repeat protein
LEGDEEQRLKNLLLENPKININVRDGNGCTPILIAANNSNFYIMRLLLNNGADPNIFSYAPKLGQFPFDNDTVLFKMINNVAHYYNAHETSSMKSKICDIILDEIIKVADLNKQTDNFKLTPLIRISKDTNSKPNLTTTDISHFGGMNSEAGLDLMKKFIKAGADITIKDKDGKDFLDYLDKELIEILSKEFENVEIYNNSKKYNL